MIDPLVSLAFSLQANPGAYAFLIGSGVSRSAGIPTGWEVTLELAKSIAAASGDEIGTSVEEWFRQKYQREPDYSDLLDQLCKSASERQQYLKRFFEPTDEERQEGVKRPTEAHHAIAEMMAEGYIRVAVTTNFDRLLEQALEAKGIVPVVISNADQAKGMLPLVHQKHCIVKVHGDYLDTRIMNTEAELAEYSSEMNRLLDQIFDEFGIVVCGWSGAWDPALRKAIARAPSRRFSSYWAVRGALGEGADKLASDRGIIPIQIAGADAFFSKLAENLASLREYDRPHPLSVQAAVSSLKRYLAEDRYRIRLHDLLMGAVQDTQERWKNLGIEMKSPRPDDATIVARIKTYDASMDLLLPMGTQLGKWARSDQFSVVCEFLKALAGDATSESGSFELWRQLARYPATQALYAVGISALLVGNFELIGRIFSTGLSAANRNNLPVVAALFPMCVVDRKESLWPLYDGQQRFTPLSDWLEKNMRPLFFPNSVDGQYDDPFTPVFDEFELLGAIAYRALMRQEREWHWVPYGCWAWRRRYDTSHLQGLKTDLESNGEQSKVMRLGIFKGGSAEALSVLDEVIDFAKALNFR